MYSRAQHSILSCLSLAMYLVRVEWQKEYLCRIGLSKEQGLDHQARLKSGLDY